MRELQAIRNDIDEVKVKIANAGNGTDTSQWQVEEMRYTDELADAQTYWNNQQAHETRVQDATTEITTRLDTLYLGGQSLRELCADEEAYQIVRISFTQDYISQATKNSEVLSQVQSDAQKAIKEANDIAQALDEVNTLLIQDKHQLTLELEDITNKFQAATQQLSEAPSSEETEKLKQDIIDLKAQLELKAKADDPKGDAKTQIDAMVEARENRKIKITNLRLADPSGINTKDYLANNALTGEKMNIHSNYVKSYKEVSEVEAEQLRADEANRVAEQELSIPASVEPVNVPELEAINVPTIEENAENTPKSNTETEAGDSEGNTSVERNEIVHEDLREDEQKSEVITLESLKSEVDKIKTYLGLVA